MANLQTIAFGLGAELAAAVKGHHVHPLEHAAHSSHVG